MKPALILFSLLTLGLLIWGFHQAMFVAPTEATMGNIQRIFYYHVPSAFAAFACFFVNLAASLIYLKTRSPRMDALALASAQVGVVFCTIVLITGPLWARPVWGIWWTWEDVRLTSTLLLWLIYVSYLLLRRFSHAGSMPVLAAVLAIFGSVDTGFVYMSIRWFRTQHPQPVLAGGPGSGLDPAMLHAFFINLIAFSAFGALLVWVRYLLERQQQRVEELHALAAVGGAR
ncbi:MAG TPA: cytochrome c biogenesis protein [Terriglobales bacterium]|nr:cytochrome c biogenesis protein [Terriglobales bacterium]